MTFPHDPRMTPVARLFGENKRSKLKSVIASREAVLQDSLAQRARKKPHPKESAESASELLGASRSRVRYQGEGRRRLVAITPYDYVLAPAFSASSTPAVVLLRRAFSACFHNLV